MDIELICPLGGSCEEIRDNKVYRCAWYTNITGTDAQGVSHDEWSCAMRWMPILQVEMASTNRGQTHAIESLRNETIKRQDAAIKRIAQIEGAPDG